MRPFLIGSVVLLFYWSSIIVSADEQEFEERPISEADSVVAIYYDDWGLASAGKTRIIFAAWPDGHAVWSEDRLKGGPPYRTGDFDPAKVTNLFSRLDKDGLFSNKTLNSSHFGPDSQFTTIYIKSAKKRFEAASWHEVYENSGKVVDDGEGLTPLNGRRRFDVLQKSSPDYIFFRMGWSETRGRIIDLIPSDSQISEGRPHKKAGVLTWREPRDRKKQAEAVLNKKD